MRKVDGVLSSIRSTNSVSGNSKVVLRRAGFLAAMGLAGLIAGFTTSAIKDVFINSNSNTTDNCEEPAQTK